MSVKFTAPLPDIPDISELDLTPSITEEVQKFEKQAVEYIEQFMNKSSDMRLKSSVRVLLEMSRNKDVEDGFYYQIIKDHVEEHAREVLFADDDNTDDNNDNDEDMEDDDNIDEEMDKFREDIHINEDTEDEDEELTITNEELEDGILYDVDE